MFEANYIAILTYLKDGEVVFIRSIKVNTLDDETIDDTLIELDNKGLVKMFTGTVGITNKGTSYLNQDSESKKVIGEITLNDYAIIVGNRANELRDAGLMGTQSNNFEKKPDLTNTAKHHNIPATKKRHRLSFIKDISIFEWAAVAGILSFIIALYLLLK